MTATKPTRRAANRPGNAKPKRLRLNYAADTEASERFRALPMKERERLIEEYRAACAPAYASVDDYLAEKHREAACDAEA